MSVLGTGPEEKRMLTLLGFLFLLRFSGDYVPSE